MSTRTTATSISIYTTIDRQARCWPRRMRSLEFYRKVKIAAGFIARSDFILLLHIETELFLVYSAASVLAGTAPLFFEASTASISEVTAVAAEPARTILLAFLETAR
jgi:hypothetical protein